MSEVSVSVADRAWEAALDIVRAELSTPAFKTWFEHTRPLGIVDDALVVAVQNDFARDWLESRYSSLLTSALAGVEGGPLSLRFTVSAEAVPRVAEAAEREDAPVAEAAPSPATTTGAVPAAVSHEASARAGSFNPKYTFESFVMGSSNQFAYSFAMAVAESPGRVYNPLLICGGVGLGKTHLLQAIGHYAQGAFQHMAVRYVSSEQFTNDFINSIGEKKRVEDFRRMYRHNDVLLVDDIQFLAGKEGTQEEFFHTFNALEQAGKQIVLSSDRPPKDIGSLEERLRTRFSMGLITNIEPPELETRIAILRRKVGVEQLRVPDDVLSFVADRISTNIRELEGALIRIIAFSSLTKHPIDLDLARDVLRDVFPERSTRPISVSVIQQEVCRLYGIGKQDLVGNKRSQSIVYPRQVAMYLARELTDLSLPRIGQEFGGRDHTTVMHATAKIQKLMNAEREVYNQIQGLTNTIRQRS